MHAQCYLEDNAGFSSQFVFLSRRLHLVSKMSTPQNSSSSNSSSLNTVCTKVEVPSLKDLERFDQFLNSNNPPHLHLSTQSGMPTPYPNDYQPSSQGQSSYVSNFYLNYNANHLPHEDHNNMLPLPENAISPIAHPDYINYVSP